MVQGKLLKYLFIYDTSHLKWFSINLVLGSPKKKIENSVTNSADDFFFFFLNISLNIVVLVIYSDFNVGHGFVFQMP